MPEFYWMNKFGFVICLQKAIQGYHNEESNHLSVATAVAQGLADVGVGIEKKEAKIVNVDFIPLIQEHYDLVILKSDEQESLIQTMHKILNSTEFKKNKISCIEGYDTTRTGSVIFLRLFRFKKRVLKFLALKIKSQWI
ncbi:hypothetical protein GCM10020331_023920 [Ectobacillus funiculus]